MTDIPRARKLLREVMSLLSEAHSLMIRPSPVRRAKRQAVPCTPAVARKIRAYAGRNPKMPLKRIAAKFNVDGGRVSEAIRGLR